MWDAPLAEKLRGTSKNTKVKIGLTEVDTCILHVGMIVCMSIFYFHILYRMLHQ